MNNINVGRINGNALCGLCEKVCIRVDKVLDGCKCFFSGVREDNIPVAFSEGSAPTAPYNFVAVEGTGGVTAQNMTVSSADAGRLRISYNALFPVSITFTDAQNRSYYALGNISQPVSVVLKNPPVNQPFLQIRNHILFTFVGHLSLWRKDFLIHRLDSFANP